MYARLKLEQIAIIELLDARLKQELIYGNKAIRYRT